MVGQASGPGLEQRLGNISKQHMHVCTAAAVDLYDT